MGVSWQKIGYFEGWNQVQIVDLYSATTFVFFVFSNLKLIFVFNFWFKNFFGFHSSSWTTFIIYVSFNSALWFWLWGHFWIFWALIVYFWGWGMGQKLCWGLLMYLNNVNFMCLLQFWHWFLPNCGFIFDFFWAPNGIFWGF